MKIRKGDKVVVISGKDRGKTGVVSRAFPAALRVLVDGVNIKKKHQKSRHGDKKGQMVEKALPIDISNVMLVDPKGGKRTRVGIAKKEKGGKRVRIAKKSGQEF